MTRDAGDWIETYLDYTYETEPSMLFRRWSAISCIAATMQRKCVLNMGALTIYPNLYVILVGPAAARKGTAIEPIMPLLLHTGVEVAADATTKEALIRRIAENGVQGIDGVHHSMNIISPELTVFIGYGNRELMSYMCDWFDCRDKFEYDTKHEGKDFISNVWVNLLGATTPVLLKDTLPQDTSVGSGFVSRTLFIYSRKKGRLIIFPSLKEELRPGLQIDLQRISQLHGQFRMTADSLDTYSDWRYHADANPPFTIEFLEKYCDRRPVILLKLCMIMCAARTDEQIIEKCDIEKAINTLHEAEHVMLGAFEAFGERKDAKTMSKIIEVIKERKEISVPELFDIFSKDVSGRDLGSILSDFCQMEKIDKIYPDGGTRAYVRYIWKDKSD